MKFINKHDQINRATLLPSFTPCIADDSINYHNGHSISTHDNDNDLLINYVIVHTCMYDKEDGGTIIFIMLTCKGSTCTTQHMKIIESAGGTGEEFFYSHKKVRMRDREP